VPVDDCVARFKDALLSLDRLQAKSIIEAVLNDSNPLMTVESLLVPVMEALGRGWEDGHLALTQVYMSGRICEELVDELLPPSADARSQRPVLALAVFEDYHLLGKRIVNSVLRSGGYKVLDYGHGQGVDELVARVRQDGVDILLISVLMLNSALRIRQLSERLKAEGLATRLIVGGAPFRFDPELWREVGADAMGYNASDVLPLVKSLTEVDDA